MYTIEYIKELSERLERGEISPVQCLGFLDKLREERQTLRERAEAMLTLEKNEERQARKRFTFNEDRSEIMHIWRKCRPLTNQNMIESIKFTKAYANGKVNEEVLNRLDVNSWAKMTDMLNYFNQLLQK